MGEEIKLLHSKAQLAETLLGNLVPVNIADLETPGQVLHITESYSAPIESLIGAIQGKKYLPKDGVRAIILSNLIMIAIQAEKEVSIGIHVLLGPG